MTMLRFNGVWPWWLALTVGTLGSLWMAWWYWRESQYLSSSSRWLLPTLRAAAFFLMVMMLAGPTLYYEQVQGELSRILVLLDVSSSMATVDMATDVTASSGRSRLQSALDWLVDGNQSKNETGWLQELRRHHRVELALSNQDANGTWLWDSNVNPTLPETKSIQANGQNSPLGDFLAESLSTKRESNNRGDSNAYAAVVFVSDGQRNSGTSMQDALSQYIEEKLPIYAVGVGSVREPDDLGIVQVEHSQQVYVADRLRGSLLVKERMKNGTSYRVTIQHLGEQVFSKILSSLDQGLRRIEFDMPAQPFIERAKGKSQTGVQLSAYPIDLDFAIEAKLQEVTQTNNACSSSLWGVQRKNRVLIMDNQGGWEMRYIKNAFSRDTVWDTKALIGRSAFAESGMPKSRAELFDFDLIIANLETLRNSNAEQLTWISDFISSTGGGVIVCDSKREPSGSPMDVKLAAFLPVRLKKPISISREVACRVSPTSRDQPALQLGTDSQQSDFVWSHLPTPRMMRDVSVVPGAEAMVEIAGSETGDESHPLLVTKLFGQGRVVYLAADETWRWRYDVADLYHQRFWNQLANWTMRTPFAINNSFASLDSGARVYAPNDSVLVRAMLKREDLKPLLDASARAVLYRNDQVYKTLPLEQEEEARGYYRTTLEPLPEGSYRVRLEVTGIPASALDVETQFVVQPPTNVEMQSLACNTVALRQVSTTTGGELFMLEDTDALAEKLKRYRTGAIVESQTLLWQSFPWFGIIVGLLSMEWYLRKREGLV